MLLILARILIILGGMNVIETHACDMKYIHVLWSEKHVYTLPIVCKCTMAITQACSTVDQSATMYQKTDPCILVIIHACSRLLMHDLQHMFVLQVTCLPMQFAFTLWLWFKESCNHLLLIGVAHLFNQMFIQDVVQVWFYVAKSTFARFDLDM